MAVYYKKIFLIVRIFMPQMYYVFQELKLRLNWLLEYKLSHPGQVTWKDNSSDILLLK